MKEYFPFISAFAFTVGIGFFATIVYAQNGGLVTDIAKIQRDVDASIVEQPIEFIEWARVEDLQKVEEPIIQLKDVVITAQVPRKQQKRKEFVCGRIRPLEQGGSIKEQNVRECEWK